jgi:hypothetical protein
MPEAYIKDRPHPGKPLYTLADAARDDYLIVMKCNGCRRTVYFLAADLLAFRDPKTPARDVRPFPCSRCGTDDMVHCFLRSISMGDVGNLDVRRPGSVKRIQTWRTVKLGDP